MGAAREKRMLRWEKTAGACALSLCVTAAAVAFPRRALAQAAPPAGHQDAAFDVMNLLAQHKLHDVEDESWNVYGQTTYIYSVKPSFPSPPAALSHGSNNSLLATPEDGFTFSFTLFFGTRLWKGAEAYFVPEAIGERPFSNLRGIGGAIQNFELQKQGSEVPQIYRSRTYLQQVFNFGGGRVVEDSNPMQVAMTVDSRRLVFNVGNFTILDVFDRNSVTWDPRQTFFNMAFMTYASWDFPSDARGYSWGATGELYWDEWAFRLGRITPPKNPNALEIDFRLWDFYGDALEIEHDHVLFGQPGAVHLLGYHNHVDTGSFDDAIDAFRSNPAHNNAANCEPLGLYNYGSTNFTAPDLCFVRKGNDKYGIGLSLEQHLTPDIGVFLRAMYSDGRTEVDAYNPADRSLSIGAVAKGPPWHRPFDVTGIAWGQSWISPSHAQYLAMGGVDGFIGDGYLHGAQPEGVFEAFYSYNLLKAIWLSADYQFLYDPAYNWQRGPVNIFGGRVHAEF
jgi:hypothetical protein